MHLRFPVVAAIVAVAAGVALVRGIHRDAPAAGTAAGVSIGTAAPVHAAPSARRVAASADVTVYVAGEVAHPGVFALPSSARAVDALRAAGGAATDADLVAVNLAESLSDGEEIVVPAKGAAQALAAPASGRHRRAGAHGRRAHHRKRHRHRAAIDASSGAGEAPAAGAESAPTQTVDINTADENELEALPGIGAALAARIVTFREINGPFGTPDDLLDVGGMTQGRLDAIVPYVTAE